MAAAPITRITNPYSSQLWREISDGLTLAGRELGLDITSFASIPARTSAFLQFLIESRSTLRQVSSESWLKVTEHYEGTIQRDIALRWHAAMLGSRHPFVSGKPL